MQVVKAYLKGVNFGQPKIQICQVAILRGEKPSPHGKIPGEVWMASGLAIFVPDCGYVFNVNGAPADQKYPGCCDERGDLQHTTDPAAKNSQPVYRAGIVTSTEFLEITGKLDD